MNHFYLKIRGMEYKGIRIILTLYPVPLYLIPLRYNEPKVN